MPLYPTLIQEVKAINNIFITFGNLTPLSWMLICSIPIFALQLILCFKAKKKAVKLIPLYLVLFGAFLGVAEYIGLFGTSSAGVISGNSLVGEIILAVVGTVFIGVILAWFIYWLVNLKRSKQKDNSN